MAKTDTKTVKAVVLAHRYSYHETSGDPSSKLVDVPYAEGTTSTRGVEIEVSQAEFDRGSSMTPPALAKAGSREAKRAFGEFDPVDPASGYSGLSDEELAAIVTQRGQDPVGKTRDELLGIAVDAATS